MASCTGRILVVKDGKDGVGIKSADVIFAVYVSDTAAPADDFDGWKTMYDKLIFAQGSFIWTATKITDTNNKSWLTGKRCLGKCEDFSDIKELYALGDSNQQAPNDGWKETYSPVKGKWLWTKNEITLQGVAGKVYTDPVCAGYFPNDGINGTKFSVKGTAVAHYADAADIPTNSYLWGSNYLVDKDTKSSLAKSYPCVYRFLMTGNTSEKADEGDAYNIDGVLWVNDGSAWQNVGSIQGPAGEAGDDAPWVVLSQNPIVFESNDKGQVESATKMTDINVMCGTEIVTSQCTFAFKESSSTHFNKDKASITSNGGETETITINSEGLGTKKIGDYDIPYPNSSVTLTVTFGDYIFDVTINIVVDTSLVDGYFRTSIKGLEAQYTEMNTTVKGNTALLSVHQSRIEANANAIKTKVSQTDYNDNNDAVDKRVSTVEQNVNSISATVDDINKLTGEWNKSGIITKANFSSMFSEALASDGTVMKRAEMTTYVKKDADGNLESGVKINADNINISAGHEFNINGKYFSVTSDNFKVNKKEISLTDTEKSISWSVGYFDGNLKMSFSNKDSSVDLYADNDKGTSLWMKGGNKRRAIYGNDYFGICATENAADQLDYVIDFGMPKVYGAAYRRSTPKAGLILELLKANNYLRFILAGLPKSSDDCTNGGQVYIDNGFLKIKQ